MTRSRYHLMRCKIRRRTNAAHRHRGRCHPGAHVSSLLCHLAITAVLISVAGCASNTPPLITAALPVATGSASVTPKIAYSRIAKGATRCWFGQTGPLRATHIFHAKVAPPSDGGDVEISVHKRVYRQKTPLGAKVYRVRIRQAGSGSDVTIDNIGMAAEIATLMRRDLNGWIGGGQKCSAAKMEALALPQSRGLPLPRRKPGRRLRR